MTPTRLSGWKMIARHLGRSERATQLWEAERGLPVRRIPGAKGWTVYAFVHELDSWMSGTAATSDRTIANVETAGAPPLVADVPETPLSRPPGDARRHAFRKPGLLVLPFELRSGPADAWSSDVWTDELIARFAAMNPSLRILSSTTSRQQRNGPTPIDLLSRELDVRYVVEGSIYATRCSRRFDLRIIDAEIDQVLLSNRFASSRLDDESFRNLVVDGTVEHFSLVRAGALVEPLYPNEIDPECHIHYLEGVRYFTEATAEALSKGRRALLRALTADATFLPALAMGALVDLQMAVDDERYAIDALRAARAISETCRRNPGARVTAAFLNAAIAVEFDQDQAAVWRQLSEALLAMPPSVALRGRLYERRSLRRNREADRSSVPSHASESVGPAGDVSFGAVDGVRCRRSRDLFARVMRAMSGAQRRLRSAPPADNRPD